MSATTAKKGRVEYSERAFQQDANEAMRGDIVRGLIEAITNCDDAYGSQAGPIQIEMKRRHNNWQLSVRDNACGMRSDDLIDKIARLGARTSGFESGEAKRGNLGRGAKDLAAFGEVVFESIRDGYLSRLQLSPTGEYRINTERHAGAEDRMRLGIRTNGTTVTVRCTQGQRCPRHKTVLEKLANHFQLRDIMSSNSRTVQLLDTNTGTSDRVRYRYPELPRLEEKTLTIEGYPEARAQLVIYRNRECHDELASDPCRPAGLLLKGARAIYENTLFELENNAWSGWFSGSVTCDYIDRLAREYDDRLEAGKRADSANPIPLITRRRDGLEHNHPFYKALSTAVSSRLAGFVHEEEQRARSEGAWEADSTRKSLDSLGRQLAEMIDQDFRETDDEDEGLPGGEGEGDSKALSLRIIPGRIVLYMGEDKTVTVQTRTSLGDTQVSVSLEPTGAVELCNGDTTRAVEHPRRTDVLNARFTLRPIAPATGLTLTARCGTVSETAAVEVRPERELDAPEAPPAPEVLEFERDRYRIQWGKHRVVRLRAPRELVEKAGSTVSVVSSSEDVLVLDDSTEFRLDEKLGHCTAQLRIRPKSLGASAKLKATLGDATAVCLIEVVLDESGPDFRIEYSPDQRGHHRAVTEDRPTQTVVTILCGHPLLKRYMGPAPDFPGQHNPATQAVVAEILAQECARIIVEKKFSDKDSPAPATLDAAGVLAEQARCMDRYLRICHRALVGNGGLG